MAKVKLKVAPATEDPVKPTARIPLPDYKNSESRLGYAKAWVDKYGPLMAQRGDTPLRINEVASWGKTPSKQMSINAAKDLGLDPAVLYSSAMEEGMSGLYPDKKGLVYTWSENKDYPVSGFANLGLDNFSDAYPGLVKKGYLPPDFNTNFTKRVEVNEKGQPVNSADFKNPETALRAKAAMMRSSRDEVDQYVNQKGLKLSQKARDFFALVNYNAGAGNARQMLEEYNEAGYLKDDAFLKGRPMKGGKLKETSWQQPYENVIRRLKMASALRNEGYFDEDLPIAGSAPGSQKVQLRVGK